MAMLHHISSTNGFMQCIIRCSINVVRVAEALGTFVSTTPFSFSRYSHVCLCVSEARSISYPFALYNPGYSYLSTLCDE